MLASLLGAGTAIGACGGGDAPTTPIAPTAPTAPIAPTTGAVELTLAMTGTHPDPRGVTVHLDGGTDQVLTSTAALRIDGLPPGSRTLTVGGLAFNCALAAPLAPVTVSAGITTRVTVPVTCGPFLRDAIVYLTEAYGMPELMATRPDGSTHVRLTSDQATYGGLAISPDGERIAVASRVNGAWDAIYLLDSDGQNRRRLIAHSGFVSTPAWSPDGGRIAFTSTVPMPGGAAGRIFVVNADGTGLRQLTAVPDGEWAYDSGPSWSPDGTRVLFNRSGQLVTIHPDGTGLTSVYRCPLACQAAVWSPDGRQIAFSTYTDLDGDGRADTHLDIYVVQADGSAPRRLTRAPEQEDSPSWSPDGTAIVFQRWELGANPPRPHLIRVQADGSGETEITGGPPGYGPVWSPVR